METRDNLLYPRGFYMNRREAGITITTNGQGGFKSEFMKLKKN